MGLQVISYLLGGDCCNLHRRQLKQSQRALIAARSIELHQRWAKERQAAAGGDRKSEEFRASFPTPPTTGQRAITAAKDMELIRSKEQHQESVTATEPQAAPEISLPTPEPQALGKSLPAPVQEAIKKPKHEREAISQAGKALNVSGRSVEAAKIILQHGTAEEITAVESGKAALKPVEKAIVYLVWGELFGP